MSQPGEHIHECPPFAIINPSVTKLKQDPDGKVTTLFGREYKWAFVDSNDPNNSDFSRLYKLIISNYPKPNP